MARSYTLSAKERRGRSRRMKQQRTDLAFEAKRLAALKQKPADPTLAAAQSERMKQQRADPAFEAKRLAGLMRPRAQPAFEPKRLVARSYSLSAEERRARSERMKRQQADPAFEAKRRAAFQRAVEERRRQRLGLASVQT